MTAITSSLDASRGPLDWDNGQPEHTCDRDCLTMHSFVPCSQLFCLLKPITHAYTPKMAEDEPSVHSASSHCMSRPCIKPPFSAFTMLLYLAFRGQWPDLAYGTSGVWALGPNSSFVYLNKIKCPFKWVDEFTEKKGRLESVLVFYHHHNKCLQTYWLTTTQIQFLTVLEGKSVMLVSLAAFPQGESVAIEFSDCRSPS
jgi:hypothetical protein